MVEVPEDLQILVKRLIEAELSTKRFVKVLETKGAFEAKFHEHYYDVEDLPSYPRWGVAGHSGLCLLDADNENLERMLRSALPETFEVLSPTRKLSHFYIFVTDGNVPNKWLFIPGDTTNRSGELRAQNQFVVAPGTKIPSGTYRVRQDRPIAKMSFTDFETAIRSFLLDSPEPLQPIKNSEPLVTKEDYPCWRAISEGTNIPIGKRHETGFAFARHLRDQGLSLEGALAVMKVWHSRVPQPEGDVRPWKDVENAVKQSYWKNYSVGCATIQKLGFVNLCSDNCPAQRKKPKGYTKSSATPTEEQLEEMKKKLEGPPISEDAKAKALDILEHGDPIKFVGDTIQLMHKGDYELGQYIYAATLTPELGYKLHLLAVGSSGVGKSDLLRKVCRCVPAKKRIKLDSLSPKSVYLATEAGVSLNGSVIYVDDADPEDAEQVKTLKMLATDDPDAMRHWSLDDNRKFADFVVNREFVMFVSCIQSLTDKQGQFLRRYEVLNPSEDEMSLVNALAHIKTDVRNGKAEETYPPEFEVAQAITADIKSRKLNVIVPFDYDFPHIGLESKTASKKFGALVWAIAKAFFKQRIIIEGAVLAQPEDFDMAAKLWAFRQPLKVDLIAMKVLEALGDEEPMESTLTEDKIKTTTWNPDPITSTTLAKTLKYAPRTIRDKLENLYDMGLTDRKATKGRGNPYAYWRSPGTSDKMGNLDKQIEGQRRLIDMPNIMPSINQSELVSSFDDYYAKSTYNIPPHKRLWGEYKARLEKYLFMRASICSPETRNNPTRQKTPKPAETEAVTGAYKPDADKNPPVCDLGGIN